VLLHLNSRARYVVGVKVMPAALVAVVTDLDASVVAHRSVSGWGDVSDGVADPAPDHVIDRIAELVSDTVRDAEIDPSDLLGVGIGLAGIIDTVAGVCRYSPFFGWRDVDLVTPLRARLGHEVRLANDVDSLTIAEQWFGHGRGVDDFMVVTVGRGVGAGFVFNGRFYGGHEGGVGELAHITVAADGPDCACGKRGCLEVLASDAALAIAARAAVADGRSTSLSGVEDISLQAIVAAAETGDQVARQLLAESGRWLGRGVGMLVNLLRPQLVIVAGEGVEAGEWRLEPMRQALREAERGPLPGSTKLLVESAGDVAWARGAACVVLGDFFKSPLHQDRPTAVRAGASR
jgi:predicted NBD/HSP70 family sugar kinase